MSKDRPRRLRHFALIGLALLVGVSGCMSPEPPLGPLIFTSTPPEQRPRAVFIGDSYTAGVGGDGTKWTSLVAESRRWLEINLGRGGTGYVTTAGREGCGLDYCPSYPEMIPQVVAAHPDIVVVSGGRNDGAADVTAAAAALFTGIREQLPEARIFAISPMFDASPYPRTMEVLGGVVQAQVERVGGRYVNIADPLKDRPDLITKDGVHPNAAGYQALAASVNAALG